MNALIEKINWTTEEYWGDPTRFKFRVYINDYSNNTEVQSGKDRMVRTTFNMTVHAYLLSDSFENKKLTTVKSFTPTKIIITSEAVSGEMIDKVNQDLKKTSYKKPHSYSYVNPLLPDDENFTFPVITNVDGGSNTSPVQSPSHMVNIINAYNNLSSMDSDNYRSIWHNAPSAPNSYGEEGWMSYDENYHYIYIKGNWLRQPLNTFESF
jgi:hypothetical protein